MKGMFIKFRTGLNKPMRDTEATAGSHYHPCPKEARKKGAY